MTRNEIAVKLADGECFFNKKENILLYPDISIEPWTHNGIQEFYLNKTFEEIQADAKEAGEDVVQYVLGRVPAPGACCGSELGFAKFSGFYAERNEDAVWLSNPNATRETQTEMAYIESVGKEAAEYVRAMSDEQIADMVAL